MPGMRKRYGAERGHPSLSISRQCALLGISRASLYYHPMGVGDVDDRLMRLVDEQYTKVPFYGSRRMAAWLRVQGSDVGRRHVASLMRQMGLAAIYPKPRLSVPSLEALRYPYLLRGVRAVQVNQIWSCDITYIRMARGFVYLMAVIDWHSRYVLAWQVSIMLDGGFCMEALERAFDAATPEIFNSDQGCQFTSDAFTGRLLSAGCRISRDGRGRALDNIFVERLWRSVKYEEVYLNDYTDVAEAKSRLNAYMRFYNDERLHQALGYQTPGAVYRAEGL
jgi:putative transposase